MALKSTIHKAELQFAIANERLKRNGAGQVGLQLKSAYWDSTTHIVMSALEFMQRLGGKTGPLRPV